MKYSRLPSPGSWRRKAITGLLVIAFAPVLLAAFVSVVSTVLSPYIPWAIGGLVLLGLYSLVIRWYRR
jgi:hypothetical protein